MKKIIMTALLTVTVLCTMLFGLTACQDDTHEHELTLHEAKAATCTEAGNSAYYSCECGKFFSDENGENEIAENAWVVPAGHKLIEHAAAAETCTENGNLLNYECSVCHKHFKDNQAAEEYEDNAWVVPAAHKLEEHAAVAETCTENGNLLNYECSVCHKHFKDNGAAEEYEDNAWVVPAGHKLEEHAAVDATCTENGNLLNYECSVCHKHFKDNGAAEEYEDNAWVVPAGHKLEEHAAVDATCTEAGNLLNYECSVCHKHFKDNQAAEKYEDNAWIDPIKDHELGELHERVDATCVDTGTPAYYECENCHKHFSDEDAQDEIPDAEMTIPATGIHEEYIWQDIPSETGEGGVYAYACSVCHEVKESEDDTVYSYKYDASGETPESFPATTPVNAKAGNYTVLVSNNLNINTKNVAVHIPITAAGTYKIEFVALPSSTGRETKVRLDAKGSSYVLTWNGKDAFTSNSFMRYDTGSLNYAINNGGVTWAKAKSDSSYRASTSNQSDALYKMFFCDWVQLKAEQADVGKAIRVMPYVGDSTWTTEEFQGPYYALVKITAPENEKNLAEELVVYRKPSKFVDGVATYCTFDGLHVVLTLPKLPNDQYTITHKIPATRDTKGTDTYAIDIGGKHIEFDIEDVEYNDVLVEGKNTIDIFEAGADVETTKDVYKFTGAENLTYMFDIPESLLEELGSLAIYLKGGTKYPEYTEIYNSADAISEKVWFNSTEAVEYQLAFIAETAGKFEITISSTTDMYGVLSLDKTPELSLKGNGNKAEFTVADSVTEGWYKILLNTSAQSSGRATIYVSLNGGKQLYMQAGRSETQKITDDLALITYLKPGDKLVYENAGNEAVSATLVMSAHTHSDKAGEWTVAAKNRPTESAGGYAERTCEMSGNLNAVSDVVFLPELTSDQYTKEPTGTGTKYSITVGGATIEFTIPNA